MFNNYFYHDSVIMTGLGTSLSLGRWGLRIFEIVVNMLVGCCEIPVINTLLSLLFITFSSMIIIKTLDIREGLSALYIGSVMITFPVVTSIFAYMFTSYAYWIACFFSILAVYFLNYCDIKKYFWAILFLILSLSLYQAYISVAVCFISVILIKDCLDEKEKIYVFKKILYMVMGICGGLASYVGVTRFSLLFTGMKLGSYQGLNEINRIEMSAIPATLANVYIDFLKSYWGGINETRFIRFIVLSIYVLSFLLLFICIFRMQNKINKILSLIILAILPLIFNEMLLLSINSNTFVHSLMRYSLVFTFVFPIVILEHIFKEKKTTKMQNRMLLVFMIILWIMPGVYIYTNNRAYLKMNLIQEETNSYYTTLVTRIKMTEGYSDEMPIAFIGEGNIYDLSLGGTPFDDDVSLTGYAYNMESLINDYAWKRYMRIHIGYAPKEVQDIDEIQKRSEVQNMPEYPDDGSIQVINDDVVVKLSNNEIDAK